MLFAILKHEDAVSTYMDLSDMIICLHAHFGSMLSISPTALSLVDACE